MTDGVWLVELASVTDPADVASAVLGVLGLREQALLYGGKPLTARLPHDQAAAPDEQVDTLGRLLSALAGQRALLVLDNCEHLVAAVAGLADRVLAACPQVRVLATSREPLNITGEAIWTVGPLTLPPDPAVSSDLAKRPSVPAIGPTGAPPGAGDYASVRLLIQRARAVFAEFRVTGDNAAAVAQICRALDGMPLAIELAAARLRTMTPEQVAARLDDRFQLLTGGSRTAMPRHQTLRAVVDWSWDLLDEPERLLWRRFSVFTGGATLEAVVQVCAGRGIGADQVLDLVTALTDKSLLTVRYGPDGARYRMLEIIRAYGQERLAEARERDELRRAHAEYFTRLAEIGDDYLISADQLVWLRKLSDDQDNLHAALRGAISAGDGRAAVRLAAALSWYWWLRSMKVEGADLIAEAVGLPRGPGAEHDSESLAVAYAMGGLLAIDTPVAGRAQDWFRRANELTAGIPDPKDHVLRLIGPLSALFGAFGDHGSVPAGRLRRSGSRSRAVGQRDRTGHARARGGELRPAARGGGGRFSRRDRHLQRAGGALGPGDRPVRPGHAGGMARRARRRGRPLPAGRRAGRGDRLGRRRGPLPALPGPGALATRRPGGGLRRAGSGAARGRAAQAARSRGPDRLHGR